MSAEPIVRNGPPTPESLIDVNLLKEIEKKALVDALNAVNGAKTLVLDPSLAGPLGLVTEVSLLKHHGVDKMFWLEPGNLTSSTPNVVYLCRPRVKHVRIIAEQIKNHAAESKKHNYTLLLVPRQSTLVTRILEEEGVLGDVTISTYNLQLIPLADDVISLENESAFKDLWVDGDETIIYDSVQAMISLQKLYGLFPRIVGKGNHAARMASLLMKELPKSTKSNTGFSQADDIDSLIILDRQVDMITPLLTQLTYEGLIDELMGIKNSHVEVPASLLAPPPPQSANAASTSAAPAPVSALKKENKKKYHLTTTSDPLFRELRDLNFSVVGRRLNAVAHRIDAQYKTNLQTKNVAQLRDFVGKLGGLQSEHQALRLHTGLSELLVPMTRTQHFNSSLEVQQNLLASYETTAQLSTIEDMIAQGADMEVVLRLLCLASITTGGIKLKTFENIKREFLQAYGYDLLPLLLHLQSQSLGLLMANPPSHSLSHLPKYPFTQLRKSLRLLIDDTPEAIDEVENDISFVYSGWAPISVRLVQCVAQKGGVISNPAEKTNSDGLPEDGPEPVGGTRVRAHPIVGWKGFEDIVALIPGESVDITTQQAGDKATPIAALLQPTERTTTTVVFFLGGCTYTEIAALRWVGRQTKGRNFLIVTTGIVSGRSIIDSIAGTRGPGDSSKTANVNSGSL